MYSTAGHLFGPHQRLPVLAEQRSVEHSRWRCWVGTRKRAARASPSGRSLVPLPVDPGVFAVVVDGSALRRIERHPLASGFCHAICHWTVRDGNEAEAAQRSELPSSARAVSPSVVLLSYADFASVMPPRGLGLGRDRAGSFSGIGTAK